jgi:hypothetical protein
MSAAALLITYVAFAKQHDKWRTMAVADGTEFRVKGTFRVADTPGTGLLLKG